MEYNLVEKWLRKDPTRWLAGALGGLFAGAVMAALAMAISVAGGMEAAFPLKLVASTLLGSSATDISAGSQVVITGLLVHELLAIFLGIVYSHFVTTNKLLGLAAMGVVWGIFSWIFLWNLFFQSFSTIYAARISSGTAFPICLIFGISLISIGFFDRIIRGK